MAYTFKVNKELKEHLLKFLDPSKHNDTKDLLAAYVQMTEEHLRMKEEIEKISDKLARFE
ncbi:MAG: hypothetical protein KGV43_03325 [Arcobacter sp.]|nr:hypothetical protein [Arcobacter sp.]